MTYKKFTEKLKEIASGSDHSYQLKDDRLKAEWYTGGMSGGNCWNDNEASYEASGESPEELLILDEILVQFRPTMTFLEYRVLYNKLAKNDTRTCYEYYGNSSNYTNVSIDLKSLYEYLKEKQWIDTL